MPEKELSYYQFKTTADKIVSAGDEPTIEILYDLLGKIGTKKQIESHLARWKNESKSNAHTQLNTSQEELIQERTKKLKESLSVVRATLDSTADGILLIDNQGKFVDFNQKFVEISKIPKEQLESGDEMSSLNSILGLFVRPDEIINEFVQIKENPAFEGDIKVAYMRDGRVIERFSRPHKLGDKIIGRVWSFRDVTKRHIAEEALRLRQRAIESSTNGVLIVENNSKNKIIYANPMAAEITGYSIEELQKMKFDEINRDAESPAEWQAIKLAIKEVHEGSAVISSRRKNGNIYWNEITIAPVFDKENKATHFVVNMNDITERKAMEKQLIHQATHDALTDLPNRILIEDRIRQMILYSNRTKSISAVLFLDLDRFKNINDSLGHKIGDDLLCDIANRLQDCLRETDTVARIGGDEFVILLTPLKHEKDCISIAEKLLQAVKKPLKISDRELNITTSIGIGCYPKDGEDANALIRNADTAMYQAKDKGRNNFQFYTAHMNKRVSQQLLIENNLYKALANHEFTLLYQPVINLKTNKIVSTEALIRWRHPTLGLISPMEFIYIAEETGLIIPIGRWVLQTACEQVLAWHKKGLPFINMAVNVSGRQLKADNFIHQLTTVLEQTNLPPDHLTLELTESILMESENEILSLLNQIKTLGVKLAIDDFGTGYSSLSYLRNFPMDKIKIDKTFVSDLDKDKDDAAIILAIIAMSKSLGLTVLAEGAETKREMEFLRNNQCDELQGYYFSKPLEHTEFETLLRENYGLYGQQTKTR